MRKLAAQHPDLCVGTAGDAHMTALHFHRVEDATAFCRRMTQTYCVDISAQTYKPNCPPAALTKLPLITTPGMARRLAALFEAALAGEEAQA